MVQAMKLKNILIVVNDIQESICFYKEKEFPLEKQISKDIFANSCASKDQGEMCQIVAQQ